MKTTCYLGSIYKEVLPLREEFVLDLTFVLCFVFSGRLSAEISLFTLCYIHQRGYGIGSVHLIFLQNN